MTVLTVPRLSRTLAMIAFALFLNSFNRFQLLSTIFNLFQPFATIVNRFQRFNHLTVSPLNRLTGKYQNCHLVPKGFCWFFLV